MQRRSYCHELRRRIQTRRSVAYRRPAPRLGWARSEFFYSLRLPASEFIAYSSVHCIVPAGNVGILSHFLLDHYDRPPLDLNRFEAPRAVGGRTWIVGVVDVAFDGPLKTREACGDFLFWRHAFKYRILGT